MLLLCDIILRHKALIEICCSRGRLPTELLRIAYFASQKGTIVLALDEVSPAQVDKVLDPFVLELPRDIPGVLYLRTNDDEAMLQAAANAQDVFVRKSNKGRLRRFLSDARIAAKPLKEAYSLREEAS